MLALGETDIEYFSSNLNIQCFLLNCKNQLANSLYFFREQRGIENKIETKSDIMMNIKTGCLSYA